MRTGQWTIGVVIVALALGCAKSPEPGGEAAGSVSAASSLVGPRWRLVELEGEPSISGGGAREPHLIFSQSDSVDRVGGATGCNSMGGTYEADATSIRFSQLFSTKMACIEEDRMRQEARFVKALESADRYAISGDTLTLSAGTEVLARFVKS
jgi:heat shock protein HslJ